ncbi:hypothetical protein JCM12296A_05870 [Desulfosarcina cetonica]
MAKSDPNAARIFQIRLDHVFGYHCRIGHETFDIESLGKFFGQHAFQQGIDKHLAGFGFVFGGLELRRHFLQDITGNDLGVDLTR